MAPTVSMRLFGCVKRNNSNSNNIQILLLLVLLTICQDHICYSLSTSPFEWPSFFGGGGFQSNNDKNENGKTTSDVFDQQITLSNGISAQVLSSFPTKKTTRKERPPLVFLHGSFHAAWCWSEKYFPYFTSLGYPVVAFSWRGTGGTPAGDGVKKVKVSEHCEDLQSFLDQLPTILDKQYGGGSGSGIANPRPVVISHSFGGIVVMKYLETLYERYEADGNNDGNNKLPSELFSGIITICSVPPSGNGKMTMRFLQRSLIDSYKITVGFAMKRATKDATLCRTLFFGGEPKTLLDDGTLDDYGVSDDDVARYQSYFARDTAATIDLLDLAKCLPSSKADQNGAAPFVNDLPPSFVMGAASDFIVDEEGNLETAKYYGLEEVHVVDSPHDVMLGSRWQNGADSIHKWIEQNVLP